MEDFEIIQSVTRKQLLAAGEQVDISILASEFGFVYPVYIA